MSKQTQKAERPGFTNYEIEIIRNAFDLFDVNQNGRIDPKEFKETMKSLNIDKRYPAIYRIIADLDTHQNAKKAGIDFDMLMDALNSKLGDKESDEGVTRIFGTFADSHNSQSLTQEGIQNSANEMKEEKDNNELRQMLDKTSGNATNIKYDEFHHILTEKTFP